MTERNETRGVTFTEVPVGRKTVERTCRECGQRFWLADCKDAAEIEAMHKPMTQRYTERDDIVKRLRLAVLASSDDAREAADLIDALRSTVATLQTRVAADDDLMDEILAELRKAGVAPDGDVYAPDAIATLTDQLREARENAARWETSNDTLARLWTHEYQLAMKERDEEVAKAREATTAVKRNHIVEAQRLIRERDAALAELATLREQADTIPPPKRRATRRSK